MDIEKLWEILYKERNTASLQELPEVFFADVSVYIKKLEAEKRDAEGSRREFIEDEIRNARMKVEDIIRRRIGKIIKLASSGLNTQSKGLMEEERTLFEGVKSHVDEGRERLFALIWGEGEEEVKRREEDSSHHTQTASTDEEKETELVEDREPRHIVRILEDIPTFMGTDGRIYKVRKEDVIMLPKTNAEILCKREVAMRFEGEI